jgi:hypothetical protein
VRRWVEQQRLAVLVCGDEDGTGDDAVLAGFFKDFVHVHARHDVSSTMVMEGEVVGSKKEVSAHKSSQKSAGTTCLRSLPLDYITSARM